MRSELWNGIEPLLEHESAWDELWNRSAVTAPTARAALLASFVRTFADPAALRTVVVWNRKRLVAAVPLLPTRRARVLHCYELPHNDWTTGATALIDQTTPSHSANSERLAELLVEQLAEVSWRALLLDGIADNNPLWQSIASAMERRGWFANWENRTSVAWLSIQRFSDGTLGGLSKNSRKNLRRGEKRLTQQGDIALRVLTPASIGAADSRRLELALDIEHHKSDRPGWTSIRSAGLSEFFQEQAELAARRREFILSFLELAGEPIAFEYGWIAKRTYHSLKVGYCPEFKSQMPGHILMWKLGEFLGARGDIDRIDCLCSATTALAKTWRTSGYPTWRLWTCRPAWLGQTIAWGLKRRNALSPPVGLPATGPPPATPSPV